MPDNSFDVTCIEDRKGVIAWRISGWLYGVRIRKKLESREEAAVEKSVLVAKASQAISNVRAASTCLSDDQLRAGEWRLAAHLGPEADDAKIDVVVLVRRVVAVPVRGPKVVLVVVPRAAPQPTTGPGLCAPSQSAPSRGCSVAAANSAHGSHAPPSTSCALPARRAPSARAEPPTLGANAPREAPHIRIAQPYPPVGKHHEPAETRPASCATTTRSFVSVIVK